MADETADVLPEPPQDTVGFPPAPLSPAPPCYAGGGPGGRGGGAAHDVQEDVHAAGFDNEGAAADSDSSSGEEEEESTPRSPPPPPPPEEVEEVVIVHSEDNLNDPGKWPAIISQGLRDILIERGPQQVRGIDFPKTKCSRKDEKQRKFSEAHYSRKLTNGEKPEGSPCALLK